MGCLFEFVDNSLTPCRLELACSASVRTLSPPPEPGGSGGTSCRSIGLDNVACAALAILVLAAAIGCFSCRPRAASSPRRGRASARSMSFAGPPAGTTSRRRPRSTRQCLPRNCSSGRSRIRAMRKPAVPSPKKSILVVSGGGIYGAYPAGVLAGWSETGTRPEFDVVTGVSTGALVGVFAFLGPAYDCELRRLLHHHQQGRHLSPPPVPVPGLRGIAGRQHAPGANDRGGDHR